MLDEVDDVDDIDDDDDDDDRRSLATIIPHELERVEEEDEEQLAAADHDQIDELGSADHDRADPIDPQREREASQDSHREAIRKQEDLTVGRPRTPEPSFDLRVDTDLSKDAPSSAVSPRTRSGTLVAPAPHPSPSSPVNDLSKDSMAEQLLQLSMQVSVMARLTSTIESQHAAAQDTIRLLEAKVAELEKAVRHQPPSVEHDLISSQWNQVRDEWTGERDRLRRTAEDWESRILNIDTSLERISHLQNTTTATLVKESSLHKQEMAKVQKELRELQLAGLGAATTAVGVVNGDLVNRGNSGLVTPPSPRSQSSDSGQSARAARRRRRRKRGSLSAPPIGGPRARAVGSLREVDNEEDEVLSESECDVPDVVSDNGGASASGVVDAVKVTESPCTTFTIEEQQEQEQGIAATTRTYPFSHYALPVHAHPKECYPVLSLSSSSHHDDGTGSSYSSSQFASEEEVEEGKKVPGRPIRVKIPGGATTMATTMTTAAVAAAEGVVQKTRDGGDDVKVTESTETTRLRPPLVSSMKG